MLGVASTVVALTGVAVGAGLIRGIFTLVHATAITDGWGATHYGRLNGLVSAPIVVVMALAAWAGTALSDLTGSYAHAYLILAAIAGLAVVLGFGLGLATSPTHRGECQPIRPGDGSGIEPRGGASEREVSRLNS